MGTQFDCRLLLLPAYERAVRDLERVAQGDEAALRGLERRCQSALLEGAFQRWNPSLGTDWLEALAPPGGKPSAAVAAQLAEAVIALGCMPAFQMHYVQSFDASLGRIASDESPNLVVLAEDDGGLYRVLGDVDSWFTLLFSQRFPTAKQRYAVGRAMIVLDRSDLERLAGALGNATPEACRRAHDPEVCLATRARLDALVGRCLATEGGALAVSESG